ncbi:MAG: hypothetical protein ACR2QV_03450 [Gammaproteobacteria bacterium]
MYLHAIRPFAPATGVRLTGPLVLLVSAVVLAQTADQADVSIMLDDLQKQEILESAGDWRTAKTETEIDDEWRQPKPKPQPVERSRIKVGYESIYDDPQIRRDQTTTTLDLELEKRKPSSAFKIKF